MGVTVKVDLSSNPAVALDAAVRRGLHEAGALVLALSNAGAPREPDPRHGIHMTETGFVRNTIIAGQDVVVVGYEAHWALYQHEHMDWHHPTGGHAKFLELAVVEAEPAVLETVAASVRAVLA